MTLGSNKECKIEFQPLETAEDGVYKFYSDGEWKISTSGMTISIMNPLDNTVAAKVQACTEEEIEDVIEVSRCNLAKWEKSTIRERAEILYKSADIMDAWAEQLGDILVKTIGKPRGSAISEITRTADIFRFTAEAGVQMSGRTDTGDAFQGFKSGKVSVSFNVPLGIILCIGPFNYPFNLIGSKIAPAIIAGNTVIIKPPTQGAIAPLYFGKILELAGLPSGVLNIVTGRGSEVGDPLIKNPNINLVSFTGSTNTGKYIASIAGMKPLQLELGGKDAAIVLDDADLELTATQIVKGAFSFSGQRCTAVKRVLVFPEIADKLIKRVLEKTSELSIGNPAENKAIGPLINSKQVDYVQSLIDDALEKGATILCGNKTEGNIMHPTIFDNVTEKMRIAWEEPFGPVLPFIRVTSMEEAISISNQSEYGLQGMIFTQNIDLAFNIAQELEVGTVQINGSSSRGPDHFPFLGVKSSGLGTQGIEYSIKMMSRPKSIVLNLSEKGKIVQNYCKDGRTL